MSTRTNCPVNLRALVATTGLLLVAGAAPGAVILEAGGWQVEVADELISDVDLYVDFVSLQDNVLVIEKFAQFRRVSDLTGRPDAINLTFTQIADDAQTISRIAIADEAVTNLTGIEWSGFEMALIGSAAFNTGLSANFSFAPFTSRSYSDGNTVVRFEDGSVPAGTTWFPGAARGELVFDIDLSGADAQVITLKELPIPLPSPGTIAVGALACGMFLRRRR